MKKEEHKEKENIEYFKKKIEELEKKLSEVENNWKRSLADYSNLEKRTSEDKVQFAFYIKREIVRNFLSFLDNLEKVNEHLQDKGLELTYKDLKQTLKDMGVEEIEAKGKEFNPNLMDAVEVRKGEKNKVLEILSKGYLLNGNLLRPAKVVVGQE